MFTIDKTDFGYRLTFGEFKRAEEMAEGVEESKEALRDSPTDFGVFVDMRTLKPLPTETQPLMENGQKLYKAKGMVRSVVILNDPVTTMQLKRIGKDSGIYEWERYINAAAEPQWEQVGSDWVMEGVDPDV
jgi:hypothetical protein